MFPTPGSEIYRNEVGEPTGWGPPEGPPDYCDMCGYNHVGDCADYADDEDEEPGPTNMCSLPGPNHNHYVWGDTCYDDMHDNDTRFEQAGVDGYEL